MTDDAAAADAATCSAGDGATDGDRGVVALSARRYRWMDRITKLAGVCLVAAGLEVGGDTLAGIALAALGVALGLATILVNQR